MRCVHAGDSVKNLGSRVGGFEGDLMEQVTIVPEFSNDSRGSTLRRRREAGESGRVVEEVASRMKSTGRRIEGSVLLND